MPYVSLNPILQHSSKTKTAHGAFNINLPVQAKALIEMGEILSTAVIIQTAEPATGFLGGNTDFLSSTLEEKKKGANLIASYVKNIAKDSSVPVALHLDHGRSFDSVKAAVDAGFSSVMIDGSSLSYNQNVELTREVVKYAHKFNVSVEGELGVLSGVEDDVSAEDSSYTNPMTAVDFVLKTGVDCLAISYGTKHGSVKGDNVKLRKEIAVAAMENMRYCGINGILVSHGSSMVPQYILNEINSLGGKVVGQGVPVSELLQVIPHGIAKINIDTDIRLATTRNIRDIFAKHRELRNSPIYALMENKPEQIDYRYYLAPIADLLLYGDTAKDSLAALITEAIERAAKEIAALANVSFNCAGDSAAICAEIK